VRRIAGVPVERIQRRSGKDNYWDMGVPGTGSSVSPTNSILTSNTNPGVASSPTNSVGTPAVNALAVYVNYPQINTPFDTSVMGLPWRGNPNFVANTIVAQDVPIITFNGLSKAYLVPGWRIGWAIATGPREALLHAVAGVVQRRQLVQPRLHSLSLVAAPGVVVHGRAIGIRLLQRDFGAMVCGPTTYEVIQPISIYIPHSKGGTIFRKLVR
jgi:hypothetical protein